MLIFSCFNCLWNGNAKNANSCGVLFFIDSHIHGTKGAVNVCFHPDSHHQVQNFGVWLDQMLTDTKGVSLPFCLSPQFDIHESASVSKNILFMEVILQDYFGKYEGHKQ